MTIVKHHGALNNWYISLVIITAKSNNRGDLTVLTGTEPNRPVRCGYFPVRLLLFLEPNIENQWNWNRMEPNRTIPNMQGCHNDKFPVTYISQVFLIAGTYISEFTIVSIWLTTIHCRVRLSFGHFSYKREYAQPQLIFPTPHLTNRP